MNLSFQIVLFKEDAYATVKGGKGIKDILAAKADKTGIIGKDYCIISLSQSCWKWWVDARKQTGVFQYSYSKAPDWFKEEMLQDRITDALADWQEKYLLKREDLPALCGGEHFLYQCNIGRVYGNAVIYCFDSIIEQMEDHALAKIVSGNSIIQRALGHSKILEMGNNSKIDTLSQNAAISRMKDTSLDLTAEGFSRINTMEDASRIYSLYDHASVQTMKHTSIIDYLNGYSSIRTVSDNSMVRGFSKEARIKNIQHGATVLSMHAVEKFRLPF